MSQTARAVIFNDKGEVLMIERHKSGEHYFVLPGGHVDGRESPQQAVMREVDEETSLRVTVEKLLYTSQDTYGNDQHIFLCEYAGGDQPTLRPDSIEATAMVTGSQQRWRPAWFSFEELRGRTVYPLGLLKHLAEDKASGYRRNPYKIVERRV